ncbi:MAG: hypothetical protein LBL06_05330 [Treponema sp.]|jgi:hypothetical protein|nr:hypothetical protein [Treponema sp.]
MKKIISFFIVVSSIMLTMIIASCDLSDLAMPESIIVKGKPGLHVPLGSPFVGDNANIVEKYLGMKSILEMMGGTLNSEENSLSNGIRMMGGTLNSEENSLPNGIRIYEYKPTGSSGTKTFIIHYQIASMPYDLGQYMKFVYTIEPPTLEGIDLRRPAEVARFFPTEDLSYLLNMTDASIEARIDDKIDEWITEAEAGNTPDTGIPAADTLLTNLSQAPAALKPTLINQIKTLPALTSAKDTAKSQFSTFKEYAEELKREVKVPLGDMAKLVKYIKVKNTGLKITGTDFEDKIEIAIPQFGIGTEEVLGANKVIKYSKGKVDGGDLYFTTNDATDKDQDGNPSTYTFTPLDETYLSIYINVTDFIEGPVDFEPSLEFEWTEASIDPGEQGKLSGEYEMELGDITNFLGDSFEPPDVKGYLYVDNLPISKQGGSNKPKVSLQLIYNTGKPPFSLTNGTNGEEEMSNATLPQFPAENGGTFTGDLHLLPASLQEIPMTEVLKADAGSFLAYTVTMGDATNPFILHSTDNLEGIISADMVVVIPLEFKVTTTTPITITTPEGEKKKYVPLDLKDTDGNSLLPEIKGDLFGRDGDGGTVDEILGENGIDYVEITLEKYVNEALPNMAILIQGSGEPKLFDLSGNTNKNPSFKLETDDFKFPFEPTFKILIPCETGEDYGTLSIRNAYDFDFNLVVDAQANLEMDVL